MKEGVKVFLRKLVKTREDGMRGFADTTEISSSTFETISKHAKCFVLNDILYRGTLSNLGKKQCE